MEAVTPDPSAPARTFSQVVFIDIPHSYPPSTPITCCYSLTAAFQPHSRDWVGIFKVGWSTTKDYHTFVWVEPCQDVVGQQSVTSQAVFKDYYLPKDEIEFYQFCYVDSSGQVRGASTPFCFRSPVEPSLDSSPEDDLLVITTQEQLEQREQEKAELQKELDQIKEENESLKRALQKQQEEAASLKGQSEQREKEKSQLVRELDQIKEENENLKSNLELTLKEADHLKEETLKQMTKQMEKQELNAAEQKKMSQSLDGASGQNETHVQEKYDRAVLKIKQLKEEREQLKGEVEAQSEELVTLNSQVRGLERELFKMKDCVQLLQVDLQSSEKEKERLCAQLQSFTHNMDSVKRENQELCRRLSEETPQTCADDSLKAQCQTLQAQCQTLVSQLREAQATLATEREESKNTKTRAEFLEGELLQVKEQMENLILKQEQVQQKSGKQELQLLEAHEMIAEKNSVIENKERMIVFLSKEKDELTRENQNLSSDIEGLRRVYTDLEALPPTDSPYMQPDATAPAGTTSSTHQQQPETPETVHLYESIGGFEDPEEESLVCRHCQESFPLITQRELEQHEQSHRLCPICTMVCDNMEQSVFEDHVYGHEL